MHPHQAWPQKAWRCTHYQLQFPLCSCSEQALARHLLISPNSDTQRPGSSARHNPSHCRQQTPRRRKMSHGVHAHYCGTVASFYFRQALPEPCCSQIMSRPLTGAMSAREGFKKALHSPDGSSKAAHATLQHPNCRVGRVGVGGLLSCQTARTRVIRPGILKDCVPFRFRGPPPTVQSPPSQPIRPLLLESCAAPPPHPCFRHPLHRSPQARWCLST